MNWIYYLLEANFYLAVFFLLYYFILRKETYYQFNRAYLLAVCVIAFVIPLLQIGVLKKPVPAAKQVMITGMVVNSQVMHARMVAPAIVWTAEDYYLAIYGVVALIMVILFSIKISRLFKLVHKGKRITNNTFSLVEIDHNDAFSFLKYLFINPKLEDTQTIVQHELVHIRQKHSIDILFLELFKIINWFNPVIYLLQNSVKELHEFIADQETVSQQVEVNFYTDFLLHNAYDLSGNALTNNFFNKNLLKRRIMMLYKKPSGGLARLKYLVALPVCAGLVCVSTLGFTKTYGWVDLMPRHEISQKAALNAKTDTAKIANGSARSFTNNKSLYTYAYDGATSMGYRYKERGYAVKGNTYFRVTITEKNGDETAYLKSSLSPGQIKMLKDKYGYTFPPMDIFTKLPLPPPVPVPPSSVTAHVLAPVTPPKAVKVKLLPPPIIASDSAPALVPPTDVVPVVKPPQAVQKMPPPPMEPFMPPANGFSVLIKYMSKYVRYPRATSNIKLTGSVIVSFTIGSDHKISNSAFIKGIGSGCDEEVTRALKSFDGTLDVKPGTYKLAVTFTRYGLEAPKPASESLSNDPSFAGEVVLVFYPR